MKTINLNNRVTVKLTESGRRAFFNYIMKENLESAYSPCFNPHTFELKVQLYELINIFGAYYMYPGCDMIFDKNIIYY